MELKGFRQIHMPFKSKKKAKTVTCKTILDDVINRIDNLHHAKNHHGTTSTNGDEDTPKMQADFQFKFRRQNALRKNQIKN